MTHDRVTDPPVDELRVDLQSGEATVHFPYATSCGDEGAISVVFPFQLSDRDVTVLPAIALGVATYLGQLCLARRIVLGFPASPEMLELMRPLAEMLYDVRRWKDGLPLSDPPEYLPQGTAAVLPPGAELEAGRSLLLWSGGKDSTLSALNLLENGYDVRPLHVSVNVGVAAAESAAVGRLARELGLEVRRLELAHPEFVDFSTRYAKDWNDPPRCNLVPFGRDLLLILLAELVAGRLGAGHVSLGHDNECRNAYFDYQGRSVPRNDVESTRGALALERYVRAFIAPSSTLLPPVAMLSEYRILSEMLSVWPQYMSRTSFCFWGANCGRCAKCLRYFLAQRLTTSEQVLTFAENPLAPGVCPELDDLLEDLGGPGLLFQDQVVYCMARLVERGEVRPGEGRLREFGETLYPHVAGRLDEWERRLLEVKSDPQVPAGFRLARPRTN